MIVVGVVAAEPAELDDRTTEVPPVPTSLTATPNSGGAGFVLTWQAAAGPFTCEVRRSSSERLEEGETLVRFLTEQRFVDVGAQVGQTAHYWVRGRNSAGFGAWSEPLRVSSPEAGPGEIVWQQPLPPDENATSMALDDAGRFYVATSKRRLLCYTAPGQLAWEVTTPSDIQTAPVIDEAGRVFVAYHTRHLSSEMAVAAWNPDGTPAWKLEEEFTETAPAVAPNGDIVLANYQSWIRQWSPAGVQRWEIRTSVSIGAPSVRGDGQVQVPARWAVSPDGTLVWSHPDYATPSSGAFGRDGTMYFGTGDLPGILPPVPGSFQAVGTDGGFRWEYACGSVESSPAMLRDDSVVFGTLEGKILRLSQAGEKIWEFDTGAPVESSPAVTADDVIWCGSSNGRLYALNDDGTVRWQWALGTAVNASPAVGPDGRVYIAADGGGVFVIQGGAPPADSPWPMYRHDARRTGRSAVTPAMPETPQNVTATEGFERGAVTVAWSPSAWAESYEVWRGTNDVAEGMVLLADQVTGVNSWPDREAAPARDYHYRVRARNPLGSSEFSAPASGSQTFRLWQITFTNFIAGTPTLAPDGSLRVAFYSTTNGLAALNPDGSVRWEAPLERPLSGFVVGPDGTTYIGSVPDEIMAVSPLGAIRWRSVVDGHLATPAFSHLETAFALSADGLLFVPSEQKGLQVFGPNGESMAFGTVKSVGALTPVVASDGGVFLTSHNTPATLLDRNGQLRWRASGLTLASAAIAPDGSFICADHQQVASLSPAGGTNWLVRVGSVPGAIGAPAIASDGTVYTATGSRLVALNPDGTTRWAAQRAHAYHPLLLSDGTIVIRSDNLLEAFGSDGTALWSAFVGRSIDSAVVADDGTLYAGGFSNLCKFAGPAGLPSSGWPMGRLNSARTASLAQPAPAPGAVDDPAASTGGWVGEVRLTWSPGTNHAWVEIWRAVSPDLASAAMIGRTLPGASGFADLNAPPGQRFHYWLRATNAAGGAGLVGPVEGFAAPGTELLWKYEATNETALHTVARGLDGTFHARTSSGKLLAISPTGELAWSFTELSGAMADPVVGPDGTLFTYTSRFFAAVNPNGTLKWKQPVSGGVWALAVSHDGGVYLAQQRALVAYDSDGVERWRSSLESAPTSAPAIDFRGRVLVVEGDLLTFASDGAIESRQSLDQGGWRTLVTGSAGQAYLGGYLKALALVPREGEPGYPLLEGEPNLRREPCLGSDGSVFVLARGGAVTAVRASGDLNWDYLAPGGAMVAEAAGGVLITHGNRVVALDRTGAERWVYEFTPPVSIKAVPTDPLLTPEGVLAFTSRNRLFVLQTALAPAPSGWAMHRANPARTGSVAPALAIVGLDPMPAGGWQLTVVGLQGTTCLVDESVDLVSWSTLLSVPVNASTLALPLPSPAGAGPRYYRVRTE
ncbi:MAG: outer membrane protein assembly factor BamB family protein [Limisphaerales bacterium]